MQSTSASSFAHLRFLVVDDEQIQLLMVEQFLRMLGAETVHLAGNGAEALAVLGNPSTPVDVVVLDVMMPDVDGIEFMSNLSGSTQSVSLIVASANAMALDAAEAIGLASGLSIIGTIHKPITPEKLRAVISPYSKSLRTA